MKKSTLLLSMVFVFALVAIVNSAAIAQDQMITQQMHRNLNDMSADAGRYICPIEHR